MKVIVASSAGFCMGVRRAVEKATHIARDTGSTVFTDGPLIHNKELMDQLRRDNVVESSEPSKLKDATLLIRAHGIPPERRRMLQQLPVRLADATCPDVARIQGLIRTYARKGFHTIIFGDPGHAEVVGLLGFAEGRGHVVSSTADIGRLPAMSEVCLVSQSTQFPSEYSQIAQAVRAKYAGAVVLDTICDSTKSRQAEVIDIAARVDAMVVVGGSHSANTMRLVELARSLKPTYHIQTVDQLSVESMGRYPTVGLTAGASTPSFIIDAVREKLEEM